MEKTSYRWTMKVTWPDGTVKTAPFKTKKQAEVLVQFVKKNFPGYQAEIIKNS